MISADRYTVGGNGSCVIEDGVIKTNSNLTKPGDQVWFSVNLKNSGTIAAILKTVDSSNNMTGNLSSAGDEAYINTTYFLFGGYFFENHEGDGVIGDKAAEEAEIILQPNEEMGILIFHEWLSSYTGEGVTMPSEGVKMNYNITLGFEQVTVQ